MLLTEGQMSDHRAPPSCWAPCAASSSATGATTAAASATLSPPAEPTPASPPSRSRKIPIPATRPSIAADTRIENLFARLKDWRRIATRYDRCAHTFMAAITIAAHHDLLDQ